MTTTAAILEKRLAAFSAFLCERGASIISPTNEWEVLRFKGSNGVSIVYKNSVGGVKFTGDAAAAWKAFQSRDDSYRAAPRAKRKNIRPEIRTLRERDGSLCFYCQRLVSDENATQEHLVAITHGGPDHISNKVLSHKSCNQAAGHMSAMEKIRIHVRAVLAKEQTTMSQQSLSVNLIRRRRSFIASGAEQ